MTTRTLLVSLWDPWPAPALLCLVALGFYGVRYRDRPSSRAAYFVGAVAVFFLALASPIGVLARGYLFSAHMLQHLLLLLVVPPLILMGLPRDPAADAVSTGQAPPRRALRYGGPWLAGVGGMWLWHERTLCNAAALRPSVQCLQTVSLLAMGVAFWLPILSPRARDRFPAFAGIFYLFAACVACTVLGILVTFSPVEVCSIYARPIDKLGVLPLLRDGWGLSCSGDQQLGGLMMWVPTCLVYVAAILATLARYYREEGLSPASSVGVGESRAVLEVK